MEKWPNLNLNRVEIEPTTHNANVHFGNCSKRVNKLLSGKVFTLISWCKLDDSLIIISMTSLKAIRVYLTCKTAMRHVFCVNTFFTLYLFSVSKYVCHASDSCSLA